MTKIFILILYLTQVKCARILAIFPTPSVSHQVVFRPITQELVKRGHEVVVITTDPAFPKGNAPENLTEINVHDVAYDTWQKMLTNQVIGIRKDVHSQIRVIYMAVTKAFEAELQNDEVKNIINKKNGTFHLLITEACVRPALAFSYVYNVPVIQISSFGATAFNDEFVGASYHPILYPTPWEDRLYNLTRWEKIQKIWNNWRLRRFYFEVIANEDNKIIKNAFGPNAPSIKTLTNNVHMLMLNVHPIWIDNQPMPPNVIFLGGIHQTPKKNLPKELQQYLDSSKNGVIYVSFGTNVIPSALEPKSMNTLLSALSRLPYDVLLKWDQEEIPIEAKNIKISKWYPQADVLRHPKIKLFVTQGGLQSTDEAIALGVPLVGVPVFADQWYNVEKYVQHKIGLKLDFNSFTEQEAKDAIQRVITDDSYRANILRLRSLMQDQPSPPLERAIWWIEHVLRHGSGMHLRAPTANMTLAQFIELDLIICGLLIMFIMLAISAYVVRIFWRIIKLRANKLKTL